MDSKSRPGAPFVKEEECTFMFPVPSHLVDSFGGVLPSKVTFRTDESDKSWNLSIEMFKGEYFFTDGWKEFEEEVDLKSRQYLMYKPAASSKQNGKKKEERKVSGNAPETTNSSLNENKVKGLSVEKKWSFCKEMKMYHQYRLDIPHDFVVGTGLRKGVVIKLRNSEGREWPVHITKRDGRVSLCAGWCDFVIDNKLMIGSKISFAWNSENIVQTQILEVGTKKKPLFNSKGKKGKCLGLPEWDEISDEGELPENSCLDVGSETDDDISEENCSLVDERWRFSKSLKKLHAHSLDFPASFSMVIGKAASEKIKLVDREKRMWPVQLTKYNSCNYFRMTSGWIDFLVGNKARVGSTVVFESIPNCNSVIKAQVIDGKNEQKELFVKRGRGRPSKRSSKLPMSP